MITCAYCDGQHPWWECRKAPAGWKPAKKSTAARKDSLEETRSESPGGSSVGIATQRPKGSRTSRTTSRSEVEALKAGTQARPVDTPKRGRPISPQPKSGRAAYQRELMRKRRAKLKAEGK